MEKEITDKKVFRVYFECNNCSNKWTEDYGKGVRVEESVIHGRCDVKYSRTLLVDCQDKTIKCPACDIENIRVRKREIL